VTPTIDIREPLKQLKMSKRRGLMLVMSSPSGAGKTTLTRRLLADDPDVVMSVSATTRAPREGELNGKDYFFVSHERFDEMVKGDEMLEYATVFDNKYGTPRGPVMEALQQGKDVLFDIDWQGLKQLEANVTEDLVHIFILPPSIHELEQRLYKRGLDSADVVHKRMHRAMGEIDHWPEYDYVLVNEDLDIAYQSVKNILSAERMKRRRQPGMVDFVRGLATEHEAMVAEKASKDRDVQ